MPPRSPSTDDELIFRRAIASDAARVVDLIEAAYRGPRSRVGWTTEADLLDGQRTDLDEVRALLSQPDVVLLLAAERSGTVLGCCQLGRQRGAMAYFGFFAVRPDLQRGGVGRRLLAEAERLVRTEWSCEAMEMTVIAQRSDLIAWYERRGYVRTGETRPFPYDDERAGLPRRRDLHFLVMTKALAAATNDAR